ncbi:MAG: phosphatase PAP2 family protein [Spirochaetota bacterium]
MEELMSWGLDVIRAVQTVQGPFLVAVMRVLTQAGSEYFYLLFLPVIFWCMDARFGIRFGLVFLFSAFTNSWLKVVFAVPRPFVLDPSVGLAHETSFALPSGHAQGSATFWGLLAGRFRAPWGLVLAIVLPLIIGFTRVYLGVHYPTDLFLGWLLGWGIALAWHIFGERVSRIVAKANIRLRIIAAAVVALGMNALHPGDPTLAGAFLGTAIGANFCFGRIAFDAASGSLKTKAARMGLGLAGLVLVYFGGKLVSPGDGSTLYPLVKFVRYGLVGAWISLGAPWLFVHLGLGRKV